MTKEELKEIARNPSRVQDLVISYLEDTNKEVEVIDTTSPFVMMLEMNSMLTANALEEMDLSLRKSYSSLALTYKDLYHHISDIEYTDVFAIPSNGVFAFMVNINSLKSNGVKDSKLERISMMIAKYTTIGTNDLLFTLLNDITITYHTNTNTIVVEQLNDNDPISIKDLGILNNKVINDGNGNDWVLFETLLKQVSRTVIDDTLATSVGFSNKVTINDQYYYTDVFMKNDSTNGMWKKMNTTHSDMVFDPMVPTMHIEVIDSDIYYKIPEVYTINGTVSGIIRLVIYTTKGKISMPLEKLSTDKFNIGYSNNNNVLSAVTPNITMLCKASNPIDSGKDQKSVEEIRDMVIYNTTGDLSVPITEKSLNQVSMHKGFKIHLVKDSLTERLFKATKDMPYNRDKNNKIKIDTFTNMVNILGNEVKNKKGVIVTDNNILIKPEAVFKEHNRVITLMTNEEIENLELHIDEGMGGDKYFITPFFYNIRLTGEDTTTTIFDFDRPIMKNLSIKSTNTGPMHVNIKEYNIYKNPYGYEIRVILTGNQAYDITNKENMGIQLKMKLINSNDYIYHYATFNKDEQYYSFDIKTDFNVDNVGGLLLNNGDSTVMNKSISLENRVNLLIYSIDATITKNAYILTNDLVYVNNTNKQALCDEEVEIHFGTKLNTLWSSNTVNYTERKYLMYEKDVNMTYQNDVYETNKDGEFFEIIDGEIVYDVKHYKGEDVLDNDGNPVVLHKKGDIKLDSNNKPIIDFNRGLVNYLEVFMLEYEFKSVTSKKSLIYYNESINYIRNTLNNDIPILNNKTLENTYIYLMGNKISIDVEINIGTKTYTIPYNITPKVTLYVPETSTLLNESLNTIRNALGGIIHINLDKEQINIGAMKDAILKMYGNNISGVVIDGVNGGTGLDVFNTNADKGKLVLNKKRYRNINNEIEVGYDVDVTLLSI